MRTLFGVGFLLKGIVFTGIDLASEMPWWWTTVEGPGGVLLGVWIYYLAILASYCESPVDPQRHPWER
jgi:hypothetical protein